MPVKRKRRVSFSSQGLAPGEHLNRSTLPGNNNSPWGWVGTEVVNAADITNEHRLVTCGLSKRNKFPLCRNKYSGDIQMKPQEPTLRQSTVDGELEEDVIVISDDEEPECSRKACKFNPNCLNYLGQDDWEDEGMRYLRALLTNA